MTIAVTLLVVIGCVYGLWFFLWRRRTQVSAAGRKLGMPPAHSNRAFHGTEHSKSIVEEVKEQVELAVESVRFDFLGDPEKPRAQVVFCVTNRGKYDVSVEEICWQVTVGAQNAPSVRGTSSEPFLLLPQTFRNDVHLHALMDHSEARYVSHAKEGLNLGGHVEAIVFGRVQQLSFAKKFVVPNVTCIVEERARTIANMYIDPTHLDPLTGLLNHKFLTENMQTIVDTAQESSPVSFAMIDIDDFKKINDEYGHLIGDDVLKAVCGKIRDVVGDKGFTIRYAGDEFCILLRNYDLDDTKHLAEKLRCSIANYLFTIPNGVLQITASVGLATVAEKADFKVLIQQADDFLRISKRNGKNKVTNQAD